MRYTFLLVLILGGCSRANPANEEKNESAKQHATTKQVAKNELDPADFSVPPHAIVDCEIVQFGESLCFESESFEKWLAKTGAFGELVALNDKRVFELYNNWKNEKPSPYDHRFCDLAYQEIYDKYTDEKLGYHDSFDERDKKIKKLIDLINSTHNSQK